MVGPDLLGCAEHGLTDYRVYQYKNGRTERRCLVCQRARQSTYHNFSSHCRRGHRKTPWTWKFYSGIWRCLMCQDLQRRRAAEKRKTA